MKIKIRKGEGLDELIWVIMMFQIMLGNFLGMTRVISLILLALIIVSCLRELSYFFRKGFCTLVLFLFCVIIYPIFSYYRDGGDPYILENNIYYIITPLAMLLYMAKSCNRRPQYVRKIVQGSMTLLNIYAILNIFVMLAQVILNKNVYSNEVTYWDSISGLFGQYGQPIITLFISAVILLNYLSLRYGYDLSVREKSRNKAVFLVLLVAYVLLAAFNDNKAFYLILLVFAGFVWLVTRFEHAIKRNTLTRAVKLFFKILLLACLAIIFLVILVRYTFVGDFYDKIMHEIMMGWTKTNLVQGSSERIGIISYALSDPDFRFLGYGIGTTIWKKEYAFGFMHFGQSDVGVFVLLGGLIFMGLIVAFLVNVFNQLFKRIVLSVAAALVMLVVGIYTQCFTNISMMGCIVLYMLICWDAQQRENEAPN